MFAMHLQYYVSRKDASKGNNIIFYALCLLYLLSLVVIVCDFIAATFVQVSKDLIRMRYFGLMSCAEHLPESR